MRRKRRRVNPWRIGALVLLIGGAIYVERVLVPQVPPLFVPTPTATRSPATYVLEAESLFQAGKLDQAAASYQRAIEINPQEAAFYIALARVQVFAGEYEEAETNARNALLIDPGSAAARAVLGWTLDFQGADRLVEAQEEVERALASDPNSTLAHAYLAEILIDQYLQLNSGDYRRALEEAERAVALDPNSVEAQRALGYVLESTGNYLEALQAYERALSLHPNLWRLHFAMGNMHINQDPPDLEKAVQSYLNANALSPTNPEPLQFIAKAYARFGEYGKASQYAADAMALDPSNAGLHGDLGVLLYENGEYEKAIEELNLAVRGGQTAAGVAVLGERLSGEPRIVGFYYTLGLAMAKSDRCEEAIPIFEALLLGVPDDEIAVANATEGLVICGIVEPTPTPRASEDGD
ncbi:MAG TPA: tetratricopeptide repeat protein [Anaerolineales bacterium]|nr:tetratricopeptide repeat protein [Anaerolineales bacterium]